MYRFTPENEIIRKGTTNQAMKTGIFINKNRAFFVIILQNNMLGVEKLNNAVERTCIKRVDLHARENQVGDQLLCLKPEYPGLIHISCHIL